MADSPRGLRKIAEEIDRYEGFRVEILGGIIMMSPSPSAKHARVLTKLNIQLGNGLRKPLVANQMISVCSPAHGEDSVIPDLAVLDEIVETESDDWLVPADLFALVVEVVSKSNASTDTIDKVEWYGRAAIPLYLLVDPRDGTWKLYSQPVNGEYRAVVNGNFGDPVKLPAPIDIEVSTDEFLPYKTR